MLDMKKLEKIKEQIGFNSHADAAQIKLCNAKLRAADLPSVPTEYASILSQSNGFSADDINVFGASLDDDEQWITDLAEYNLLYRRSNQLTLGYDDCLRFFYDASSQSYQLYDNDIDEITLSSSDPLDVLLFFLRIQ